MEAAVGYVNGDADSLLMATELRLGLPGTDDQKPQKTTAMSPPATPRGKKRTIDAFEDTPAEEADKSDDVEAAPPVAKAQVVGWPPVRSYRKSCFQAAAATKSKAKKVEDASSNYTTPSAAPAATSTNGGSFVKVSMDGAPYLRKIDMRMYKGYRELREALEAMFVCFSGADGGASNGANPSEYAITYEDKDGDLMLVGDVPFDMFSGTCKKLRIIKRSEATGLGSK